MQGFLHVAILLIAIIATVSQVRSLTPEETCPLVKNNTFISDGKSCDGWAFCRNGKPIYGKCNSGQYYDAATGVCDYRENVQCNINVEQMCTGLDGVFKADPNNCANYCYCHDGKSYCQKCPTGQFFNISTVNCVWASTSNCDPNSRCRLVQNGFMGDGETCNGYLRCGFSQIVLQGKCEKDLYYNPNNGMCDYQKYVGCTFNPSTTASPTTTIAPKPGLCDGKKKFYSDDETCRGFFYCTGKDATPQWGQCPKGSHFSADQEKCLDPDKVNCEHNRCEGSSKSFMAKIGTECKDYWVCKGGVTSGYGSCPTNNSYFNEIQGICQPTPIDSLICK